jgi:hypothetical protein
VDDDFVVDCDILHVDDDFVVDCGILHVVGNIWFLAYFLKNLGLIGV